MKKKSKKKIRNKHEYACGYASDGAVLYETDFTKRPITDTKYIHKLTLLQARRIAKRLPTPNTKVTVYKLVPMETFMTPDYD